jgi:hypothetical protein
MKQELIFFNKMKLVIRINNTLLVPIKEMSLLDDVVSMEYTPFIPAKIKIEINGMP